MFQFILFQFIPPARGKISRFERKVFDQMLRPVVKKRLDWPRLKLKLAAIQTSQHSFQIVWLRDVKKLTSGRYLKTVSAAILEQVATRFIPVVPSSSGTQKRSRIITKEL